MCLLQHEQAIKSHHGMCSQLLLFATVWSFAHMPLGLSDHQQYHRSNQSLPMFLLKKWPRRLLYCRNWKVTANQGPFFNKFLTPDPDPGPSEKPRILPESIRHSGTMATSGREAVFCGYWNLIILSKNFGNIEIRSGFENIAKIIIRLVQKSGTSIILDSSHNNNFSNWCWTS